MSNQRNEEAYLEARMHTSVFIDVDWRDMEERAALLGRSKPKEIWIFFVRRPRAHRIFPLDSERWLEIKKPPEIIYRRLDVHDLKPTL